MRTIKHGVINFGMVAIPVAVAGTKTSTHEPKFSTLHETCGTPIKQQKRCETCHTDLEPEDMVKGYEVAKGEYVTFTQEEIDSVSADRDTTIDLTKFIRASEIRPEMVKEIYWLVPPENPKLAEKYGLLYQSLAESKRAGVGTESLWGKEAPCAVVPVTDTARGLQLYVLQLQEDLVPADFEVPVPKREEKKLAKELIEAQTGEFNPQTDLVTEQRARVHALIASRVSGEDLPVFEQLKVQEPEVDVMEALRASVKEIEERKAKEAKRVKTKA